jgi:hypothetical protein
MGDSDHSDRPRGLWPWNIDCREGYLVIYRGRRSEVRLPVTALLLAASAVLGFGLEPAGFDLVEAPQGGWLTPEFSSTVGFSYVTGGGRSFGTGSYVGTLHFDLARNLRADLDIGYARIFDFRGPDAGGFIGGLDLDWNPTDNLRLLFHYSGYIPTEVPGSL